MRDMKNYLKERSYDNYGKWHYKHRKLRRAYFSMRRNIELLFEFEMTKNIPKHNNSIEASFRWLKDSLNRHSGLKNRNKIRFIVEYFISKIIDNYKEIIKLPTLFVLYAVNL